jgi:acetoin utilization deacetylase AcuC-like enzyme
MGSCHPECPERLSAINDQLLITGYLNFMDAYDAPMASIEQISRAHSALYVQELIAQSPKEGYQQVDPDTKMNPHSINAALRAAGAAIQATDLVLDGVASNAFCCVRPPGHHAEHDAAMGFCFFNNVAIGIRHALDVRGLQKVALIDFDVHHGNGSEDIFRDDERVLMCSIFEIDLYPFTGELIPEKRMVNIGLPTRSKGEVFREAVEKFWIPALEQFQPEMIYISAGFDAHREDDMGNLGLVEADYEWVTKQIVDLAQKYSQGRIVSCLEGGYVLSPLARSVAAHIKVLIGAD